MKIVSKKIIVDVQGTRIVRFSIAAGEIAAKARPGQFIVLMVIEDGERVPLTIVDADSQSGEIAIIVQEAGFTTRLLGKLNEGDSLYCLVGPLGHPTPIEQYGTVIIVAGGVGIAEILPVARSLKAAGNKVVSILGARTKALLILEEEVRAASHQVYCMTDDGSYGAKGFTTDKLKELLLTVSAGLVYAVGPIPMMRHAAEVAREYGVAARASLNALMVDGTGMCGCCRVTVGGKLKFSCVDGPEFDAAQVDWNELTQRNAVYVEQEKHVCRLSVCARGSQT